MTTPGNADVPVGIKKNKASGNVGATPTKADEDVGAPRSFT